MNASPPTASVLAPQGSPVDTPPGTTRVGLTERMLRWVGHQRWIRYGVRERLLRALRHPEKCPATPFEVPFAGFAYPGRMNRWIDWIVFYYGAYEQDELEYLRSLFANRGAVALDIGANVGHHSLYLASFCAQVHAFEPYDEVAAAIDDKIRRNRLEHIVVHRVGLSDRDQVLDFYAPQGVNTGTGTFVQTHEAGNNRLVGQLTTVCADEYLARLQLAHIDVVKIDVEGFEVNVLRGLANTLRRHRPTVLLELSDEARAALGSMAALMALFPEGYRADVVLSRRPRWLFFGRRGCELAALRWSGAPAPGGYLNLLLRPVDTANAEQERACAT